MRRRCPPGGAGAMGVMGTPGIPGMAAVIPEQGAAVGTITDFTQAVVAEPGSTPILNASFTISPDSVGFTNLLGRLTYTGTSPRRFLVVGQLSGLTSLSGTEFTLRILRNNVAVNPFGGQQLFETAESEHVSTSDYILLQPGDTIALGGSFAVPNLMLTVQSAVLSIR